MKRFKYVCFIGMIALSTCLILGCAAGTTATKTAEVPKIFIHPDSGKPSAAITIWGTGFKPGEEVDIVMTVGPGEKVALGTEKVEVIKANEHGAFTAKTAIYVRAKPGDYAVEASGSQGSEASEKLTVLPK
jgi:hypothetical protein